MKKILLVILFSWFYQTHITAQQNTHDDPIGKSLYPPELIMQNQAAISLTEEQRTNISKEIQTAQTEFMSLQWELQKEVEQLKKLIEKEKPSEKDVLEQLEKVLGIENKIKKKQITLLLRLKNILTAEQKEKLQKIK